MKNQIKLFCIALAGAFTLTACGGPKLIGVTLPETPLVLATGETATAETSYTYDGETPENAQPEVVYTSGDAAIATVDENGVITGVAEGETTITATVGELSASRTVSVIIPVDSLTAEDISLHLADGAAPLTYVVTPEHFTGNLTFASADESIATVDAAGQVTPVAVGDTTVTVTAPNGLTATAAVHVWDGPKALTLTPGKTEITTGGGTQIAVADEAGNEVAAESLTWTSSDESIANRPQRHHTAAVRSEREHNPLRRGRSGTKGPAGSVCPARSGWPQDLQSVQAPAAVRRMGQAAGRSIQPG